MRSWLPNNLRPAARTYYLISMPHRGFDDHDAPTVSPSSTRTSPRRRRCSAHVRDGFPIRQMQGSRRTAATTMPMAADNTSAFNWEIRGAPTEPRAGPGDRHQPLEIPTPKFAASRCRLPRSQGRPPGHDRRRRGDRGVRRDRLRLGRQLETLKDYQHFPRTESLDESAGAARVLAAKAGRRAARRRYQTRRRGPASEGDLVAPDTGELDATAFNAFLAGAAPPVGISPARPPRVLLQADRSQGEVRPWSSWSTRRPMPARR